MYRQKLVENFVTFMPQMFKRLMKGFPAFEISKQQLELLFRINGEDGKPMSHYSEKMMVPKPNLTVMADKLIEEGLIERGFDPNDRRVIILKITKKGEQYLSEHRKKAREFMMKKFDSFNDSDIKRLNEIIEEMKIILNKLKC